MAIAFYMDQHVPRAITIGLRLREVDVITAHEDGASTARHKSFGSLGRQRTASVCPLEWLSHRAVEIVNELQNTLPQVIR